MSSHAVIEAIEAGHGVRNISTSDFDKTLAKLKAGESAELPGKCALDGDRWPCEAIRVARRAPQKFVPVPLKNDIR